MLKKYQSLLIIINLLLIITAQCFAIPSPALLSCSKSKPCLSPSGYWLTIDDKTKHPRAVIEITMLKQNGINKLVGFSKYAFYTPGQEWSKTYRGSYKPFNGKLIGSFPIMWDYESLGDGRWGNGKVFDIDGSKVYNSHLALKDSGNHLKLSGCILFLCRSQTWVRLNDAQFKEYQHLAELDEKKHPRAP